MTTLRLLPDRQRIFAPPPVFQRLMRILLALLCALALPAVALAQNPTPPSATTGEARDVRQTGATLTATVDPNGAATTVRFEYGTTTSYGLASEERSVQGADPVEVTVPVGGLTSGTTYHYRVVATNAAGTDRGADRTFTTDGAPAPPQPPGVTTGAARSIRSSSAVVTGRVDPNGAATSFQFEYGTSSRLGSRTATQDAGSGAAARSVTASLTGLAANDRIYYRLVATNPAGTRRGRIRSFVTTRALRGATIALSASRVAYGDGVTITGRLIGSGLSGVPVVLEVQAHPFAAPFGQVGLPDTTGSDGAYRFTIDPLLLTSRMRVTTRTSPSVTSPVAVVRSVTRVGLTAERRRGRRVRFRGIVRPAAPRGFASLQRRTSSGAWVRVRRAALRRDGVRSRYSMTVRARRAGGRYRVVVTPRDGGAHSPGTSRERVVAPLR